MAGIAELHRVRADRSTRAASTSPTERRLWTASNPSWARAGNESASHRCCRRSAEGGGRGDARRAFRSSATSRGTSRTIATAGRRWPLRGLEQLGARPFLDVRGVDDRQPSAPEAHLEQPMEEIERVVGRSLGRRRHRRSAHGTRPTREPRSVRSAWRRTSSFRWRRCRSAGPVHRPGGRSPEIETDRRASRRSVELPWSEGQPWASQSGHISESGIGAFGWPIARGRARPQIVEPGSPTRWTLLKWRSGRRHVT